MSVAVRAGLQMLLQLLEKRRTRIMKGAYLTKLIFNPPQDNFFSVQAHWADGGMVVKRYYYDDHFFHGRGGPKLKSTPCRISQDLIRDILQTRNL